MEFLFTDKGASVEALILLICLVIMMLFLAQEGYIFLRRFVAVFGNRRPSLVVSTPTISPLQEENKQSEASPIPENTIATVEESLKPESTTEEGSPHETVDEEEIYREYVALVEETHTEKEKQIEEEKSTQDVVQESNEETPLAPVEEKVEDNISEIEESKETEDIKEGEISESEILDTVETSDPNENTITLPEENHGESIPEEPREEVLKDIEESKTVSDEEHEIKEDVKEVIEETSTEVTQEETITESAPEEEKQEVVIPELPKTPIPEEKPKDVPYTPPIKNHSETIFALINTIRTVMARGQLVEARALIIQGLALDKGHRELNLMLGSLYEGDRHFEKAEYVYKDLAIDFPDDIEILEKLGNVLIIEKRYSIALEIYKKILSLGGETEGTLYILSHLCHEMNDASEGYIYMKKYLKSWPNNPEILALISEVEVELGKRKDAIETLKRLKNLTPYNGEITATLQKLMMEEELAGNFGNQE